MITITIQGANAVEVMDKLFDMAAGLSPKLPHSADYADPNVNLIIAENKLAAASTLSEDDLPVKKERKPRAKKVVEAAQPEVQAQDEADEVAESEAAKEAAQVTYTMDDVRAAAKPYIAAYGMVAAQDDLQGVLEKATGFRNFSGLAESLPSQETMKAAIDAILAAVELNPANRTKAA